MQTENKYSDLLEVLLRQPQLKLTIEANVVKSSVHRGLKDAIAMHNEVVELNESLGIVDGERIPDYIVSVQELPRNTPSESKKLQVSLVDPSQESDNKFKSKFDFKIIEDSDDAEVSNDLGSSETPQGSSDSE